MLCASRLRPEQLTLLVAQMLPKPKFPRKYTSSGSESRSASYAPADSRKYNPFRARSRAQVSQGSILHRDPNPEAQAMRRLTRGSIIRQGPNPEPKFLGELYFFGPQLPKRKLCADSRSYTSSGRKSRSASYAPTRGTILLRAPNSGAQAMRRLIGRITVPSTCATILSPSFSGNYTSSGPGPNAEAQAVRQPSWAGIGS